MNKNPLEFLVHKELIDAGKTSLGVIESLELDYNDAQNSLLDLIAKFPLEESTKTLLIQVVLSSSIFTPNKKANFRKRILDRVNESSRQLAEEFQKYKIEL